LDGLLSLPSRLFEIFTIGHSNRSLDGFLGLLAEYRIGAIADVRRFPTSRKFPYFNQEALARVLNAHGIDYVWFESLGGFRHSAKKTESPNMGLESLGFRNYADHMLTAEFRSAVQELLSLAGRVPTALMCAERFYWKCHRRILSDFLNAQGAAVTHLLEEGSRRPHALTPGAVVRDDGTVTYPPPPETLDQAKGLS
jgi:uncharacterized protein (DUF488 family)